MLRSSPDWLLLAMPSKVATLLSLFQNTTYFHIVYCYLILFYSYTYIHTHTHTHTHTRTHTHALGGWELWQFHCCTPVLGMVPGTCNSPYIPTWWWKYTVRQSNVSHSGYYKTQKWDRQSRLGQSWRLRYLSWSWSRHQGQTFQAKAHEI